jgi:hypothetical protein
MIKDSGSLENVIKNLKEKNKASEESNALPKEQT